MPDIVIPDVSEIAALADIIAAHPTLTFRLFQNDITPDADTVIGDFTEADYSGYASQDLDWGSTPDTDSDGRAFAITQELAFPVASSGSQTVYGWYAEDETGTLRACVRYDSPFTVTTALSPSATVVLIRLYS